MNIDLPNYFHGSLASVGLAATSDEWDIRAAAERELAELDDLDDEHGTVLGDLIAFLGAWVDDERALATDDAEG